MRWIPIVLLAAACAVSPPPATTTRAGQRALELFASFFGGTFETISQPDAVADSVTLRHVPIWPGMQGERWFYVEYQRQGEQLPFRQRIIRLYESGSGIGATPYELPEPASQFAGEWRNPSPFARLSPATLRERPDCRMVFLRQGEVPVFNGGTEGTSCRVSASTYEAPEYSLTSSSIRHWIPVFEAPGKRVDGPPGPWEFRKVDEKIR